jgi:hypothetical protein
LIFMTQNVFTIPLKVGTIYFKRHLSRSFFTTKWMDLELHKHIHVDIIVSFHVFKLLNLKNNLLSMFQIPLFINKCLSNAIFPCLKFKEIQFQLRNQGQQSQQYENTWPRIPRQLSRFNCVQSLNIFMLDV